MLGAVKRAIELYYQKDKWNTLLTNIMNINNSWSVSAEKYMQIYGSVL
jgi:starch synthase